MLLRPIDSYKDHRHLRACITTESEERRDNLIAGLSPVIPPVVNLLVDRRRHSLPRGLAGPGRQVLTASDSDTPNILDAHLLLGRPARAAGRPGGESRLSVPALSTSFSGLPDSPNRSRIAFSRYR